MLMPLHLLVERIQLSGLPKQVLWFASAWLLSVLLMR
jgi:hypothetical protein